MSKEDVRKYIEYLWEMNRPLYKHEMVGVMERLRELEAKVSLRQKSDIKFLSDIDLCERYEIEPRTLNPKYVGYVIDEEDKTVNEKIGSIVVSKEYKMMRSDMKTDFIQMRNNLIKQLEG